ncbi:MAG TPA: extensin family protein [Kofleriaceae bacterium]|nr:extensin family protein [Kofleriaceae bacterium]
MTGIAVFLFLATAVLVPSPAAAGKRRNMPDGWVWPPSPAMKRQGQRCLAELDALGVVWKKAPRTRKVVTPIYLPVMELGGIKLTPTFRKGPFLMDCHLALALARHGEVMRQIGISELRFSTIHEYRQVRLGGRKRGMLSRHALGLAMDIFEIVTDRGERVVVKDRYRKREPTLLALERSIFASMDFRSPLTPGNDRSHRDHFHIEARVDFVEDRSVTAMLTR